MKLAVLIALWVLCTVAMCFRIRQNRKRYRIRRANRTMRSWIHNRGIWHDFEDREP